MLRVSIGELTRDLILGVINSDGTDILDTSSG